jgi:hypothetical protein
MATRHLRFKTVKTTYGFLGTFPHHILQNKNLARICVRAIINQPKNSWRGHRAEYTHY